ncbi:phage late control D family protein [Tepidibacter thalassicus]|uniref:Phage protein D n=1 Tax=Tepidibacter thalassicus DSM 15285 TaxID=1123350 RepID=A0A1M5NLX1_9FIRM|nr:contractile injection system protein, VgrG/Pvc8 family [Tepidibacter thalassicus]SHG90512.1 Phage protein D [Tepidibacter thalassicus DSM 15285]
MSNNEMARRVEIRLEFEGVDISADVNKYFLSMTYTDNEEDKTDDLQLTLDDREGVWLGDWLNTPAQPQTPEINNSGWKIGDEVIVNGKPQYSSYGRGTPGSAVTNYKGKVTKLNIKQGVPYPIHVEKIGWFAENQVEKISAKQETMTNSGGAKGAMIHALIVQKNWDSTGKDKVLDCGLFEIDSVDGSGPPAKVSLKGTSIPYTSTIRKQKKTKAWENIFLKAIAEEIASKNGMKCMFESAYNPYYDRREQVQQSDIVFLKTLCKNAGISLKVTAKTIVLFDAATYEKKDTIRKIKRGESDVKSYRFSTNFNDTAYDKCHVSYTNPKTGKTIEYTYQPRNAPGSGQVLEINEKVNDKEEARKLAMKRLREKNKKEFTAEFTLVGDLDLVAGVTVDVGGYGAFDGKYIIESATHNLTGGYTVNIKLRRVLEEY